MLDTPVTQLHPKVNKTNVKITIFEISRTD